MVVVLRAALYVHAAGIPISLLGNALRAPMGPDTELRISKPVGSAISFQRFPVGPKRTCDRVASKIAITVCGLPRQCGVASRKQTYAACKKVSSVKPAARFTIHLLIASHFLNAYAQARMSYCRFVSSKVIDTYHGIQGGRDDSYKARANCLRSGRSGDFAYDRSSEFRTQAAG